MIAASTIQSEERIGVKKLHAGQKTWEPPITVEM
jgi:hypothetical protein